MTLVLSSSQVLSERIDLRSRVGDTRFQRYLTKASPRSPEMSKLLFSMLRNAATMAETFQVSADMSRFTEYAAGELSGVEKWDHTLAPSPYGIVRWDRPIPLADRRGSTMLGHWLIWGPLHGTDQATAPTALWWFNDTREPDDVYRQVATMIEDESDSPSPLGGMERLRMITGNWAACFSDAVYHQQRLGPNGLPQTAVQRARVIAEGDEPAEWTTNATRLVYALWTLLGQTIVLSRPADLNRRVAKLAKRRNLPGQVTTVTLRHYQYEESGEQSNVLWSYRWMVRGHWAWRRCGASTTGAVPYEKGWRVRVWIRLYAKGPQDAGSLAELPDQHDPGSLRHLFTATCTHSHRAPDHARCAGAARSPQHHRPIDYQPIRRPR